MTTTTAENMAKIQNSPIIAHIIAKFWAFKGNSGPICGLQCVYSDLLWHCNPSIGLKSHSKA